MKTYYLCSLVILIREQLITIAQDYYVANFVAPLTFGYYSSEPKVRNRILELKKNGKAFYSENIYGGVVFKAA